MKNKIPIIVDDEQTSAPAGRKSEMSPRDGTNVRS